MEHQATPDSAEAKPRLTGMEWVKEKRIFLGSAAVSAACAAIAVIGQIDFYKSIPQLPHAIAYLFPIGVESISWVFGAAAAWCVAKNLPSAKYSRRMWAFAAFAAAVNGWHSIVQLHNMSVGIVLGLASLFGPFVWHSYTGMTRVALSGRSFEEIKVAAKTKLLHPWISWRASRIQTLLQCSSGEAWVYALTFKTSEIRRKVKESMARKLERASLAVMTVDGATMETPKPASKPKAPAAKPAAERADKAEAPAKATETEPAATAPVVDITLVRKYGEKSAEAIVRWLDRLDQTGKAPSYRSIDDAMGSADSGLAKKALPIYFAEHGDPREKRQQQDRKEGRV